MSSLLCRHRGRISTASSFSRYVNCSSVVVDGVVKHTPCPVVSPALADEYSISSLALVFRNRVPLSSRLNVDAVDLPAVLSNFNI